MSSNAQYITEFYLLKRQSECLPRDLSRCGHWARWDRHSCWGIGSADTYGQGTSWMAHMAFHPRRSPDQCHHPITHDRHWDTEQWSKFKHPVHPVRLRVKPGYTFLLPAFNQSALVVKGCGRDLSPYSSDVWHWPDISAQQIPTEHIAVSREMDNDYRIQTEQIQPMQQMHITASPTHITASPTHITSL